MGMCAIYQEVKKEDFKKLLESDDFFETIEELEEKDGTALCDIDKMWDALHFLLNGLSAIYGAPEDNLLSEFIIGSESFNDEAEEFARYIPTEKVIEIDKKFVINPISFPQFLLFSIDKLYHKIFNIINYNCIFRKKLLYLLIYILMNKNKILGGYSFENSYYWLQWYR